MEAKLAEVIMFIVIFTLGGLLGITLIHLGKQKKEIESLNSMITRAEEMIDSLSTKLDKARDKANRLTIEIEEGSTVDDNPEIEDKLEQERQERERMSFFG